MKIRIRFAKRGEMRFIGHLDIMRYFQKSMRRANDNIAYSQGFSPHQIMSFASPLGMGLTSEGEYMDIEVNESDSSQQMVERLNAVMAEGMEILSWRRLPDEGKTNAMATIAAASYRVTFADSAESVISAHESDWWIGKWNEFLAQPSIMIRKKTKKNEMEMDIRPLIYKTEFDGHTFELLLSAGSVSNLKPEAVIETFFDFIGMELPAFGLSICRLDMYASRENSFVSLEELGDVIHE